MHAFLIIGDASEYINGIEGKKLEFPFVKIADLRELNNFTRLKLTEKTTIILRDFDKSTEEAQNAFLKSLEEPQANLTYILIAMNIENVLSTVVSRCEVVELSIKNYELSEAERENINEFIDANIGKKLESLSKITKRDEAIEFIKNLIIVSHENLVKDGHCGMDDEALKTLRRLEANGNVGLQLTSFILALQS